MKAQDPASVVRESEFATARRARAELTRIEGIGVIVPTVAVQMIKRLNTGEQLLAAQRKDLVDTSTAIVGNSQEAQIFSQAQAREFAEAQGLNPDQAVPDLTLLKRRLQPQKPSGHIIIYDLESRQPGFIPLDEFDPINHLIF